MTPPAVQIARAAEDAARECAACCKLGEHGSERGRTHTCGAFVRSLVQWIEQRDTEPANAPPSEPPRQSWSGAQVVPRGSSKPPPVLRPTPYDIESVSIGGHSFPQPLTPYDFGGSDADSHYTSRAAFAPGPDMNEGGEE